MVIQAGSVGLSGSLLESPAITKDTLLSVDRLFILMVIWKRLQLSLAQYAGWSVISLGKQGLFSDWSPDNNPHAKLPLYWWKTTSYPCSFRFQCHCLHTGEIQESQSNVMKSPTFQGLPFRPSSIPIPKQQQPVPQCCLHATFLAFLAQPPVPAACVAWTHRNTANTADIHHVLHLGQSLSPCSTRMEISAR